MKLKPTLALSLLAITGVSILFANSEKQKQQFNLNGVTNPELEERMTRLEEKVTLLELENQRLKESIVKLESVTITPKENWKKKEFIGETFYITPATDRK